jgi:hypothetical protein
MSACARCRWGPGTTAERPPNTEAAKQLEGGLAAMMAARQAQDCTYFPQEQQTQTQTQTQTKQPIITSQSLKTSNWPLHN